MTDQNNKKNKKSHIMFKVGQLYEICINPNDYNQYPYKDQRFITIYHQLNHSFHQTKIKYKIYPEISAPWLHGADIPRMHFHGTIEFTDYTDIIDWYEIIYQKLVKNYNIAIYELPESKIKERNRYFKKSKHIMSLWAKKYKTDYPMTNNTMIHDTWRLRWHKK